jgi:hypothetical protein
MRYNRLRAELEVSVVKSFVKNPLSPPLLPPEAVLREVSPAILAHLGKGCPSCSAGLRLLADPALLATRDRFHTGFAAGLKQSPNPVLALHAALAELNVLVV